MNILILSGSPRKGGNTDLLVEAFVKGASQRNHVEVVSVRDYKVNPCMGCNACFKSKDNICAQKDDMSLIYEKMNHADMLVIASPVYFYELSAQLKAVIDRCHNPIRDTFRIKKMALLLVGAATLPELFDSILSQYQLCLNFFLAEMETMLVIVEYSLLLAIHFYLCMKICKTLLIAEAVISFTLINKLLSVLHVYALSHSLRLDIWANATILVRSFIPQKTCLRQSSIYDIHSTFHLTVLVCVFNSQYKISALMLCDKVSIKRSS